MANRLVNKLGGTLAVKSERGQGSTFYFTLSFIMDEQPLPEESPPCDPEEIAQQLTELVEKIDMGFMDVDTFLATKIHLWNTTPWRESLRDIVEKTITLMQMGLWRR